MAYESYPNTPHTARAVTLVEHENMIFPISRSGLVGAPALVTGTLPVFGDSSGRQVKIRAGVSAIIRGTRFTNLTETIVAVTANGSGNPRIDLLVLRLNRSDYQITPVVIAGTAAASPVAPTAVTNAAGGSPDYWDIPIAEITVTAGSASITAAQVKNRAWWISESGYTGWSTARPTAMGPGTIWRENDTGIAYVISETGVYQVMYRYATATIPDQAGWTFTDVQVTRDGLTVNLSARLSKTGTALGATSSAVFSGVIPDPFKPPGAVWGLYHASDPSRAGVATVITDGTFTITRDNTNPINVGTAVSCGLSWTVTP